MKTIYKYPLGMVDSQIVILPIYSKILTVQLQKDQPMLWAIIDTNEFKETEHIIEIYGTGHGMNKLKRKYISTIQLGSLIFHVFERIQS